MLFLRIWSLAKYNILAKYLDIIFIRKCDALWIFIFPNKLKIKCERKNTQKYEPHHEKTCLCHLQTTKVQISLRIRAVWSAPLLFAAWIVWTASSEFGTYRLCEQRRFRRACASAQSRQNLRCSLIQAVSQEEPSDRKPDPWPLWMAGHAQLKF